MSVASLPFKKYPPAVRRHVPASVAALTWRLTEQWTLGPRTSTRPTPLKAPCTTIDS
ncbi:MAG: hypothetical protein LBD42_08195 [Desulfovibrio sp.]|nr:hypothetical protein [Desulfovibrio sp.]